MPEGWVWTTLPELCVLPITDGTHQTPTYTDKANGIPFLSSKDVTSQKIDWTNIKYITKDLHEILYKRIAPQKNDILLAKNGTTGVAAIVEDERVFDIYVTLAVIRPSNFIDPKFLLYIINSVFCKKQFNDHLTGIGLPNLHLTDIKKTIIPVPPYKEQVKIVDTINRLFKWIDVVDKGRLNTNELISQTKAKILDLAIHGKLVPQDPTDEPAIELLKRINPKAEITSDNGHYQKLPEGWAILKVGNVAEYINGRAFKPEEWEQTGLPIIRIQNLNDPNAYYNRTKNEYEEKYLIKKGDLLFAWAASLGTYIWKGEDAWLNQHIFKVIPYPFMDKKYLYYAFHAMITEFYRKSHGSGMIHITRKQFEEITIWLPPLTEQYRIVQYLQQVFEKLDSIVENL